MSFSPRPDASLLNSEPYRLYLGPSLHPRTVPCLHPLERPPMSHKYVVAPVGSHEFLTSFIRIYDL